MMEFGKYRGYSLEEMALGKRFQTVKGDEGYHYFHSLANGDRKYFGLFQDSQGAMNRWRTIHHKLNNFKAIYPCAACGASSSTRVSIARSGEGGYSMEPSYICCNNKGCGKSLTAQTNDAVLYPLGFDTILLFGWSAGGRKNDEAEVEVAEFMRTLAGWKKGRKMTAESATEFIDGLTIR